MSLNADAAQIETSVVSHLLELVDEADKNKDGKIDFDEWEIMGRRLHFVPFLSHACLTEIRAYA